MRNLNFISTYNMKTTIVPTRYVPSSREYFSGCDIVSHISPPQSFPSVGTSVIIRIRRGRLFTSVNYLSLRTIGGYGCMEGLMCGRR